MTMTSASALVDTVALMLFQNIREGMEAGRITNLNTAQTEVEAAIAELKRRSLLEGPTQINDLVEKLLLEIGSLHEKVARCESQLVNFKSQAEALKEETTQIVARAEACNLLVEQQQKENSKVLAALASGSTTPTCLAPVPSYKDAILCPTPSRPAIISFPGGPRTVTIHPPGSPSYQSTIRDEKGDVIITFKGTKPLRREGAFRGPIEDIDWTEIYRVHGRAPELWGSRGVPSVPRWPDASQPSSCPPPSRGPSEIIARQHKLTTSLHTDAFGRVLAPDNLANTKLPSLPTGMASSSHSLQNVWSSSGEKHGVVITTCPTPPSPSVGRGKKRSRPSEEDEIVPSTTETREEAPLLIDPQTTVEPKTPTPLKREESHQPEGPAKRKRLRSSESVEPSSARCLSRSHSLLDVNVPRTA